jgi:NTP pyrophosphatase (non-canonical NTP hydrolase)
MIIPEPPYMSITDYQLKARKTAIYPIEHKVIYPALGLAGESGEVCEKIKKYLRGDYNLSDEKQIEGLEKEIGDVLWYLANLASDLHLSLDIIAEKNLEKLSDRQNRNVLKGDGDNR